MALTKKIAILFSGEGSNMENLIKRFHQRKFGDTTIEISLALSNRSEAAGIQKARTLGLEPVVISHKAFASREEFDAKLVDVIAQSGAELTILAGFMRILTPVFTSQINAINLHPSLLPLFKGGDAIGQSFRSDMKVAGVSVHMVSAELDGGEIIDQACFEKNGLDFEEFCKKIKEIEHDILPRSVAKLLCLSAQES